VLYNFLSLTCETPTTTLVCNPTPLQVTKGSRDLDIVTMDPQVDLPDLVEDLEVNIDELSDTLSPLLTESLSTTASSLPLLDKAKLYVLAAYSVESLLYSTLQASGVNAKEHAIFKELARLKGYFAKIKQAEERMTALAAPKAKLDVGAAARFIRHGLAGNDKYDLERAERLAKEKARAQLKARQVNKKFDDNGEEQAASVTPQKRPVKEVEAPQPEQSEDEILSVAAAVQQPAAKKLRVADSQSMDVDSAPSPAPSTSSTSKKSKPKRKQQSKKNTSISTETSEADADTQQSDTIPVAPDATEPPTTPLSPAPKKRTTRSRKRKSTPDDTQDTQDESGVSARAPKTRSEALKEASDGAAPEKGKKSRGRPKKVK
jgi:exosome complex protein LRP1